MALSRLEYQFRSVEPKLSWRVWTLTVALADQHGLELGDAIRQVE